MKIRKFSAILLAGALMASPAVMPAAMAETLQAVEKDENGNIVDPSGYLEIEETVVTGVTDKGKEAKEIKIPDGVTEIGNSAFYGCENLTDITIPKSVTYIDGYSFEKTPWLENKKKENPLVIVNNILIDGTACTGDVVIPEGVTAISSLAFYGNKSLTNLTIPDSVTKMGLSAVSDCTELKTVNIGAGLKEFYITVKPYAYFSEENIENINVSENNKYFSSVDGVLFNKDKTVLLRYPAKKEGTTYSIPKSVTSLEMCSFIGCKSLSSLIIHDEIEEIKLHTFDGCDNLKDIYYTGTEEQWNNYDMEVMFIDTNNTTIHYNYVAPTDPDTSTDSNTSDSETSSNTESSSDPESSSDSEASSDNSSADSTDTETSSDSNSSGSGATSPDTGVAGLSLTLGIVALAGATVVISKKKR